MLALVSIAFTACEDYETYAEQKEKERAHINQFIAEQGITVIDMATFIANDSTTDLSKNEYVLFEDKGVYMQIVRKGVGEPMAPGDREEVLSRSLEYNIADGDTISGNLYATLPDYFTCNRTGDSFTAEFTQGYMLSLYNSSVVPEGWLLPLSYITPGRPNDKAAKVRLILPHSVSTKLAAQYVYPTYYEITYIPEPNI